MFVTWYDKSRITLHQPAIKVEIYCKQCIYLTACPRLVITTLLHVIKNIIQIHQLEITHFLKENIFGTPSTIKTYASTTDTLMIYFLYRQEHQKNFRNFIVKLIKLTKLANL